MQFHYSLVIFIPSCLFDGEKGRHNFHMKLSHVRPDIIQNSCTFRIISHEFYSMEIFMNGTAETRMGERKASTLRMHYSESGRGFSKEIRLNAEVCLIHF